MNNRGVKILILLSLVVVRSGYLLSSIVNVRVFKHELSFLKELLSFILKVLELINCFVTDVLKLSFILSIYLALDLLPLVLELIVIILWLLLSVIDEVSLRIMSCLVGLLFSNVCWNVTFNDLVVRSVLTVEQFALSLVNVVLWSSDGALVEILSILFFICWINIVLIWMHLVLVVIIVQNLGNFHFIIWLVSILSWVRILVSLILLLLIVNNVDDWALWLLLPIILWHGRIVLDILNLLRLLLNDLDWLVGGSVNVLNWHHSLHTILRLLHIIWWHRLRLWVRNGSLPSDVGRVVSFHASWLGILWKILPALEMWGVFVKLNVGCVTVHILILLCIFYLILLLFMQFVNFVLMDLILFRGKIFYLLKKWIRLGFAILLNLALVSTALYLFNVFFHSRFLIPKFL